MCLFFYPQYTLTFFLCSSSAEKGVEGIKLFGIPSLSHFLSIASSLCVSLVPCDFGTQRPLSIIPSRPGRNWGAYVGPLGISGMPGLSLLFPFPLLPSSEQGREGVSGILPHGLFLCCLSKAAAGAFCGKLVNSHSALATVDL